jgi:hypothetical protein
MLANGLWAKAFGFRSPNGLHNLLAATLNVEFGYL